MGMDKNCPSPNINLVLVLLNENVNFESLTKAGMLNSRLFSPGMCKTLLSLRLHFSHCSLVKEMLTEPFWTELNKMPSANMTNICHVK